MGRDVAEEASIITHETDDEKDRRIRAELLQEIRDWEVGGILWSEIDADGKLRFYVSAVRMTPENADRGNVTMLNSAARKRRREGRS
jgi:hypothetical protein